MVRVKLREGVLCFGCWNFCRGDGHSPLWQPERRKAPQQYACGTPARFRAYKLLVFELGSDTGCVVKSLRVGFQEQLAVPTPISQFSSEGLSISEVCALAGQQELLPRFGAMTIAWAETAAMFYVETSVAVKDIALIGYYCDYER